MRRLRCLPPVQAYVTPCSHNSTELTKELLRKVGGRAAVLRIRDGALAREARGRTALLPGVCVARLPRGTLQCFMPPVPPPRLKGRASVHLD